MFDPQKRFKNTDPTKPWNYPEYQNDPTKPWNDERYEDDPTEPWNQEG